jgi:hypothetical protein
VRGGKHYIVANKARKQTKTKAGKPKKSVKLSSQAWYQKAAASYSISNRSVMSPSIAPE